MSFELVRGAGLVGQGVVAGSPEDGYEPSPFSRVDLDHYIDSSDPRYVICKTQYEKPVESPSGVLMGTQMVDGPAIEVLRGEIPSLVERFVQGGEKMVIMQNLDPWEWRPAVRDPARMPDEQTIAITRESLPRQFEHLPTLAETRASKTSGDFYAVTRMLKNWLEDAEILQLSADNPDDQPLIDQHHQVLVSYQALHVQKEFIKGLQYLNNQWMDEVDQLAAAPAFMVPGKVTHEEKDHWQAEAVSLLKALNALARFKKEHKITTPIDTDGDGKEDVEVLTTRITDLMIRVANIDAKLPK
ncbi:MAG: hypothetical protein Q7S98_07110 [Deltaproteobacteria bacterium]|nr:hypothetical protein [Deltaproteobacteria bacterium]